MGGWTEIVSGDVDLDVVNAFAAAETNHLRDLLFAVGDHAEAFVIHVRFAFVAQAAGNCDFGACRADAGPGQSTCIHLIANDDVEPQLRCGGTITARKTMIEQRLRIPHGEQDVLFGRNVAKVGIVDGSAERDMRVSFHKAGHQRSTTRFDHDGAVCGEFAGSSSDGFDSGAFDKHVGGIGGCTATIPHAGVLEKNWLHGAYLLNRCTKSYRSAT